MALDVPLLLAVAALAVVPAAAPRHVHAGAAGLDGTWVGTYELGGPGELTLDVHGDRAVVVLRAGQSDPRPVAVSSAGGRLRFEVPGRPTPLVVEARAEGSRLAGTVRQGGVTGPLTASRGSVSGALARGVYGPPGKRIAVVDDPHGPPRLVDLATGSTRGLFAHGDGFAIGSGFATELPAAGCATFSAGGSVVAGRRLRRVPLPQLEVRFRAGDATLSGTLTLPPGPGRHPAVVFVQGSGRTERSYLPDIAALVVDAGVGVLAVDRRGIGQSGGAFPGESPTESTIDVLAADAVAAVRFLRRQPEIDPARVGLAGHSQAGWVMPLAALREPSIRFLLALSAPTVTTGEVDRFQTLTGQGERHTGTSLPDAARRARATSRTGVDPMPWLRRLRIPSLWVYGALDQHVPARASAALLAPLAADPSRDVEVVVLPGANHALVRTETGLTSEMLRSPTFAPGLAPTLRRWLARR